MRKANRIHFDSTTVRLTVKIKPIIQSQYLILNIYHNTIHVSLKPYQILLNVLTDCGYLSPIHYLTVPLN